MSGFKLFDIDDTKTLTEATNVKEVAPCSIYNPIARQKEAEKQARQVYADYQNNARKAQYLKADITKGIQSAENPYNLLLEAIECISLMTGDSLFYTQSKENIMTLYGTGLQESEPLHIQLKEVRKRLAMLQRSELQNEPTNDRIRINQAIKNHQLREAHIMRSIAK